MKSSYLSFIAICISLSIFSCKNNSEKVEEAQETPSDTIAKVETPAFMYVTASSGLSLREFPNLQSEKVAVMPLGTKVKIINAEGKTTMNVGGIYGAMDEVEYNNKKGFAFNGFLSKFFPPDIDSSAKGYAESLKIDFPQTKFTESTGGTASAPTKTETILLPTNKWHEGFYAAQQLFGFPKSFAFPNPKGSNDETVQDAKPAKNTQTSKLNISRKDNELQRITYRYKTTKFSYTVTISKDNEMVKLEKVEEIE